MRVFAAAVLCLALLPLHVLASCPSDGTWPTTANGNTATLPCGDASPYHQRRTCSSGGVWQAADITSCPFCAPPHAGSALVAFDARCAPRTNASTWTSLDGSVALDMTANTLIDSSAAVTGCASCAGSVKAFTFDGTNAVEVPVNINPAAHAQLTIEILVKVTSAADPAWAIGSDDENGGYDRAIMLTDSRYGAGVAAGSGGVYTSTLPAASTTQFMHIVASYDATAGTGGQVDVYAALDGVAVPSVQANIDTSDMGDVDDAVVFFLGQAKAGSAPASMHLAAVRVYSTALNAQEVLELYRYTNIFSTDCFFPAAEHALASFDATCSAATPSNVWHSLHRGFSFDVSAQTSETIGGVPSVLFNDDRQTVALDVVPANFPQLSFEVGFYLRSKPNNRGWIIGNDASNIDRAVILHDDRFLPGEVVAGAGPRGNGTPASSSLTPLALNRWYYIAVGYQNGVQTKLVVDCDTNEVQTFTANNDNVGDGVLTLGSYQSSAGGGHHVHANVALFRVYDTVISDADRAELCISFKSKTDSTLAFSAVSIASNETDPSVAFIGSQITLTFSFAEAVTDVAVDFFDAAAAGAVSGGPTAYTATYTIVGGEGSAGVIPFSVSAIDAAGNRATATSTTDSSSVSVDGTAPVVSPVSIVSNNTDDTATAVNGDLITVTFSTDEDVGTPTVTIAGRAATVTGGPRDWTATIVSQGGDATGTVQFSITDVTDSFGNTAAEVTATTDSSQVVRGCGDLTYGATCSCSIAPSNDLTEYPMDLILYTETDTPPAWTRLEDGKLHIVYEESIHYSTVARVFNNTDDLCSQHWTWTSTVDEPSCTRTWEGEMIWANWEDCDIERSTSGDNIEFLVSFGSKATEVIPGLRDGPETRTVKHIMPFTLGFPTRVTANASDIVAFSPVVEIGAIVEQTLKGTPGTDISMDVSFLTSVQWPFVLESATWGAITADDNGAPDAFTLETTAGSCDDNNATEPNCQNTWSSTVYPASQTTTCELDGQYTVNWVVDCHDSVKASNDCPIDTATDDATLTFTIDTSSFCVQVADTVTLTANIYTYEDAAHTILKDDFLDGQTVYAEVPTSSDKVSIDSTRVVDATIVRDTEADIGLIADGDVVLPNDYAVARADGGSSAAGVSSKPSFQFTVNTASTHMDLADDSSETMTLAATVAVRYQNAGQAAFSKVRFETALQTKEKDVGASTSVGFGGSQGSATGTSSAASSEATIMGVNAMVVYGAGAIMALVLIAAYAVLRRSDPTPAVDKSESQVQLTSTGTSDNTV